MCHIILAGHTPQVYVSTKHWSLKQQQQDYEIDSEADMKEIFIFEIFIFIKKYFLFVNQIITDLTFKGY